MANKIQVKRSAVASKVPTTGDLDLGEIAINTFDGKMFIKKDNGTASIVEIGSGGGGSGDVVGPSSATDNAISRYDGTTGKLIQNSTVTVNDDGTLGSVNGIEFDTTPTNAPTAIGSMAWDAGDGTPYVVLDTDVSLQLGQENVAKVYNGSGATIAKGKVVAVSGAQGQRPSVVLADADSEALSAPTLGIAAEDILNGTEGFVCTFGLVRGIDTSGFTAGDDIYLSQTAGEFTATRPLAPAHTVFLGWVVKVNASSGEVFVHINNGWELDELHNVLITSPVTGNLLVYNGTTGVWENSNTIGNTTTINAQFQLGQDYAETRYSANSSTSITLDLSNGTMQDITLTDNATITMPTAASGKSFLLMLRTGAGGYAVTWATVKWPSGTIPTITTTASRMDMYSFFSDGTNWYGVTVAQNYTP